MQDKITRDSDIFNRLSVGYQQRAAAYQPRPRSVPAQPVVLFDVQPTSHQSAPQPVVQQPSASPADLNFRRAAARTISDTQPAVNRPQKSLLLRREGVAVPVAPVVPVVAVATEDAAVPEPVAAATQPKPKRGFAQTAIYAMSATIFLVGLLVSAAGWRANHKVEAQVSHIASQSTDPVAAPDDKPNDPSAPSTAKPSAGAVSGYSVPADTPRYINIPSLKVHSRVLALGVAKDGSLATPNNVHDAGWITGSSKPGKDGAMVIDGHVSGWTTHGVFYGLKTLKAGDLIEVVRGDGQKFTYKVAQTKVYASDSVDMQAASQPIDKSKQGLNLITCTGQVKPGTSEFNQRLVVFAERV